MRILITGSNGLLGQKIVAQCVQKGYEFLATSKGENRNTGCPNDKYFSMDISNETEIKAVFESFYPTHVIHTAAITNVDYCELNPEECTNINVKAVNLLFLYSSQFKSHFQLLSTDFIFDGLKGNYNETDIPNPLSVYANSKLDAEKILQSSTYSNWSIVRTIIVYGTGDNLSRNNIICWAKEALSNGQEMNIVDDQFRAPTWADDLAWACLKICELNEKGIFHIAGPETLSIYEIVERIADYFHFSKQKLIRTSSKGLNQPAKRPPKTGFDLTKARVVLGYKPKTIEETLSLI